MSDHCPAKFADPANKSVKKEHLMKKIWFLTLLSLLAINTSSLAQSDTLPDDLGKKVSTPEGLKKVIDSKDFRFAIVFKQ
jgi:hypothetical protein